ncbi:unnamed protein product [Ectocarpus sp. 4 AP-2014]
MLFGTVLWCPAGGTNNVHLFSVWPEGSFETAAHLSQEKQSTAEDPPPPYTKRHFPGQAPINPSAFCPGAPQTSDISKQTAKERGVVIRPQRSNEALLLPPRGWQTKLWVPGCCLIIIRSQHPTRNNTGGCAGWLWTKDTRFFKFHSRITVQPVSGKSPSAPAQC